MKVFIAFFGIVAFVAADNQPNCNIYDLLSVGQEGLDYCLDMFGKTPEDLKNYTRGKPYPEFDGWFGVYLCYLKNEDWLDNNWKFDEATLEKYIKTPKNREYIKTQCFTQFDSEQFYTIYDSMNCFYDFAFNITCPEL